LGGIHPGGFDGGDGEEVVVKGVEVMLQEETAFGD